VADQDGLFELQVIEKGGNIPAVVLDGALLRPAGRLAVPAQVARRDFMRFLKGF
jgi:hypothetical protein